MWPRVRDAALIAVCLLLLWQGVQVVATTPGPRVLAALTMLVPIGALPWRRRHPTPVFLVAALPNLAYWLVFGAPENAGLLIALSVELYAVGRWEPVRSRAYAVIALAVVAFVVHEWRDPTNVNVVQVLKALPYDGVGTLAWLLGAYVRIRGEQQVSTADRIAAEERTRIARELHDIVAHGIGVMVVQAEGAAEVVDQDRVRAKAAMERVAQTGRESLVELRRALGMLREPGEAAHDPLPGLARVEELLDLVRQSGLKVRRETTGTPTALSPGVDLALYRVVQEALTNTLRHASARRVLVRIEHEPAQVRVEVTDDGRALPGQQAPTGGGLLGIRERVAMLGGEVDLGPLAEGGFRVRVRVPTGSRP